MNKTVMAMLLVLLLGSARPVQAEVLAPEVARWFSFLTGEQRAQLAQGTVFSEKSNAAGLGLRSDSPVAAVFQALPPFASPTVVFEAVYLLSGTNATELERYNQLQAIEAMTGLTYWSATQKRQEVLVLESWRVGRADKGDRRPDPVFDRIPALQSALIHQKDNRFGSGFTEVEWTQLPEGSLLLTLTNKTTLSVALLPVVGEGALRTAFVLIPFESSIAVCARLEGRTLQIPGLSGTIDESIRNRLTALVQWLTQRLETTVPRSP